MTHGYPKGMSHLGLYFFIDKMKSGGLDIGLQLKSNKENVSVGDKLEFELEIDPEVVDTFK